jgi:DNA-binding IclR family transcriptional regulator
MYHEINYHAMSETKRGLGGIKTAWRVFDILELAQNTNGITRSDVAEELDVARSTAHDYLTTLEDVGYLVREDEQFYLGLRFLQYGAAAQNRLDYLDVIIPTLKQYAEKSGEALWHVAEESGDGIYLVEKKGPQAAQMTGGKVGEKVPLHASAAGKVILADQPDARLEELNLPALTPDTITDREILRKEIHTVREIGVAFNDAEHMPGLRGVACPIRRGDSLIGAVGVGGPAARIRGEFFSKELPTLLGEAANEIELNLRRPNF